ncbi:hypothetical protein E2C01_068984 [Portunus trituberculatus]|uniref:Uncharacterized protein n=1 Tax=Portunus trituberculatus TaxID=210409 RepID=A0A5B7HZE8_PORTR|nr:hypothetical protein [Portunus trituberculatus]
MAAAGSPQTPKALPERGAARRLNPLTPGLATEETGSTGACKPLNPGATPGSGAARKLIPTRPENSLEAPDTAGVCTTLTAGATLGSRGAPKLTPPKPESLRKSLKQWVLDPPHSQSQTRERGRTHTNSIKP